jgi:hypothetical protein
MRADLAAHAWFVARYRELAGRSYYETRGQWEAVADELRRAPRGLLTAVIVPALWGSAERSARGDAHRRVARTALAVHNYRARHGRLPAKLADLTPEPLIAVPEDPYDGKPLRFRRNAAGAAVYSVGPDGRDDGGARFDRAEKTGDLAIELPG